MMVIYQCLSEPVVMLAVFTILRFT
jgi:hypothetical protein